MGGPVVCALSKIDGAVGSGGTRGGEEQQKSFGGASRGSAVTAAALCRTSKTTILEQTTRCQDIRSHSNW